MVKKIRFALVTGLLSLVFCGCASRLPSNIGAVRNIEYARVDGQSLQLDIYRQRNVTGKLPVVIWVHGGSWNSGSKDFCPIAYMAEQHEAIVSIDYRLSEVAPFPAQLYDCKGAIRWLRANAATYNLDADHIGIFGASAGGHLALLLADTPDNSKLEGNVGGNLNFSSRVQCVCAFYPPTDLDRLVSDPKLRVDTNVEVATLIGGTVAANLDKARAASPLTYVNKDCAPVFLMHGGADTRVPPEQSIIFYNALRQAGVEAQLEIVPKKGHGIIAPPRVATEIYQFYDKYLKPPAAGPGMKG